MPSEGPWAHHQRSASVADDIEFEVKGQELQFVEIELDPGESAVAEAGAFVWKDASVEMATVFGDGSGGSDQGFMGKLLGAGRRLVTGEPVRDCVRPYRPGQGACRLRLADARRDPADAARRSRRDADLPEGQLPCRRPGRLDRHSVSAADHDRPVRRRGLHHAEARRRRLGLRPDGRHDRRARAWRRRAAPRRYRPVSSAYTPSIDFDLVTAGGVRSVLFGGEGLFFARLTGPRQGLDPVAALLPTGRTDARRGRQPRRPEPRHGGSVLSWRAWRLYRRQPARPAAPLAVEQRAHCARRPSR